MRTLTLHHNDIGRGNLILVNPFHSVRCEAAGEDLTGVCPDYPGISLERRMADMLAEAMAAVSCGNQIVPVSGYRSEGEQRDLYADSLLENGEDYTRKFVALPGCSEHQTGLAIDLAENSPDIDFICPDFPYTGICQAFREKSVRYGFIERYPAGSEHLTHIAQEPWHFRYVGYPHSQLMSEEKLTLEEYTDYIKGYPYKGRHLEFYSGERNYEIFYVPMDTDGPADVDIPDEVLYGVSGNNVDGAVVTIMR